MLFRSALGRRSRLGWRHAPRHRHLRRNERRGGRPGCRRDLRGDRDRHHAARRGDRHAHRRGAPRRGGRGDEQLGRARVVQLDHHPRRQLHQQQRHVALSIGTITTQGRPETKANLMGQKQKKPPVRVARRH